MIKEITYETILEIWKKYLWVDRKSKIEPQSAMMFLKGYDIKNFNLPSRFIAYMKDDKILGVNSGHFCHDNTYRSRGLYVFPEYRNQGIATSLLKETIKQGIDNDASFVWSYPRKSSWGSYKNAGFVLASDWHESETSEANAFCKYKEIKK